ncbi:MAG TPA: GNAT family N-acetyltransferase [Alphaproteobacteria bacterium]|nr:GNAT family N-acetyltransferase [Alphaproteobacteria bacterium]
MPPAPPMLAGRRIRVTLARDADAMALLSFHRRNRDHLRRWSPPVPDAFYTISYWSQWAAQTRLLYDHEQAVRLVFRLIGAPEGIVIGQINFSNIVRGPFQAAYLGYQIDAEHEGLGLMSEALRLAVDFMFGPFGLHRIMANYIPDNERSARLLERLGFEKEGYARDYLFIDGDWRDHVLTALINREAAPPARPQMTSGKPTVPAKPSQRLITRRGLKV